MAWTLINSKVFFKQFIVYIFSSLLILATIPLLNTTLFAILSSDFGSDVPLSTLDATEKTFELFYCNQEFLQ